MEARESAASLLPAVARYLDGPEVRNLTVCVGSYELPGLIAQSLSTKLPLDKWTPIIQAIGCRALQAQLSDIHSACVSVSSGAVEWHTPLDPATLQSLSPMLDPVITAVAQ